MGLSSPQRPAGSEDEAERFEEMVRRSLLLDDVFPLVTVPVIRTALGQFGSVQSVQILSNPLDPNLAPKRVLVEMASAREVAHAIKEIQDHALMIKAVPRPVTAMRAEPTLFPDRPRKIRNPNPNDRKRPYPNSTPKFSCAWVERGHPDWNMVHQQKVLAKKHATESLYLMQELRKEEEKLAQEQEERVTVNIKKLDMIDACMKDKTLGKLSWYYGSDH